eukprot:g5870.t1
MSRRKKGGRGTSSRYSRMSQNSSKTAEQKMPKIEVIIDGVDVTPKSLLSDDMRSEAAKNLGDPNSSKTFMGELSMQSFGFQELSIGGSTTSAGVTASKANLTDPNGMVQEMPTVSSKVEEKSSQDVSNIDDSISNQKHITEAEKNQEVEIMLEETPTVTLLNIRGVCVMNETEEYTKISAENEAYEKVVNSKATSDNFNERNAQTFNFAPKNKEVMASPPVTQDIGCSAATWDIFDEMKKFDAVDEDLDDEDLNESRRGSMMGVPEDTAAMKVVEQLVASTVVLDGCLLEVESTGANGNSSSDNSSNNDGSAGNSGMMDLSVTGDVVAARKAKKILSSPSLLRSLEIVEAAISQNVFHNKHLLYRDIPDITKILEAFEQSNNAAKEVVEEEEEGVSSNNLDDESELEPKGEKPSMEWLWSFKSSVTVGRNVSDMKFNPANGDLLAVAYGQYEFSLERKDGIVCLWSLKNPMWPQIVIPSASGATSLDWSNRYPNMLAVGYYDGTIVVYDVSGEGGAQVLLDSNQLAAKHTDAVWGIKWIDKGMEQGEMLVSISTDGRVTEWSIKKGLASSDLMVLKRINNEFFKDIGNTSIGTSAADNVDKKGKKGRGRNGGTGSTDNNVQSQGDGIISRRASGLCFDFPKTDSTTYMVGTEDGILHRCSVSYNEQYLDNYFGHAGPVYHVRFSPFSPNVFLSCSADWTIKLWHTTKTGGEQRHILSFQPSDLSDHVSDIRWSPYDANLFGSVTGDGRVQIWNITKMDPQISLNVQPDFTEEEKARFKAAEEEIEAQKKAKIEREKEANDPLAMLALQMKRKKGNEPVEEVKQEEFDIEGAESKLAKAKNLYKSLTCIEFSGNAPVVVVGSADGTVSCYRVKGLDILPLSDQEQLSRLEGSMFDALSMNDDGGH